MSILLFLAWVNSRKRHAFQELDSRDSCTLIPSGLNVRVVNGKCYHEDLGVFGTRGVMWFAVGLPLGCLAIIMFITMAIIIIIIIIIIITITSSSSSSSSEPSSSSSVRGLGLLGVPPLPFCGVFWFGLGSARVAVWCLHMVRCSLVCLTIMLIILHRPVPTVDARAPLIWASLMRFFSG